jgi:stringent starvation protein B
VSDQTKLEEKKQRLLSALDQGLTQVHLDARRPGVIIPDKFKVEHHLVLNVSYRFDPPDLTVSDWGVRQTLSFGGSRFQVGLPWSAIYAVASLVTREFWMYPDDMPVELADSVTDKVGEADLKPATGPALAPLRATTLAPPPDDAPPPRPRTVLREVVLEKSETDAAPSAEPGSAAGGEADKPPTPPRRGHLRVVK